MPQYERYASDLIQLLRNAKARAAKTTTAEMTPKLFLEAFLDTPSDLRQEVLEKLGLEVMASTETDTAEQPTEVKVTLSPELRSCLEAAESACSGVVTATAVLRTCWASLQVVFSVYLRSKDGQPITLPVEFPELRVSSQLQSPIASEPSGDSKSKPPHTPQPQRAVDPKESPENSKRRPLEGAIAMHGRDLSSAAANYKILGREQETEDLISVLVKYFKPNAILLGDAGVGKTAIVEGLAQRIESGNVPPALIGKRIIELPVSSMVSGTKFRGEFEERIQAIIAQAESDPSIILFIDEIHMLVGAGVNTGDQGDAADIFKPALARGKIRIIGATTWGEYYSSLHTDPAIKRRFHEIRIEEPGEEAVLAILNGVIPSLLTHHRLEAAPDSARIVFDLCRTELPSRRFPDKAMDVLDRACAKASLAGAKHLEPSHVRTVIATLAGTAFTTDSPEFNERLTSLEKLLKQKVLRQDAAVSRVARVVRLCKRRLDLRTHRPDGVFLFVGKSGVGKTALANALAEILHGSEKAVIRLDMTGFGDPTSISSLLGSRPGYVNSNEEPAWLERLRKTPSAVLLLDELEKAHPEVTKVFLRAFDEGVLTDARGNEYTLANVTVVATSNAVVDLDRGEFGFHSQERDDHREMLSALQAYFSPEFLNRFDEIIPFEPLTTRDLEFILREKILPELQRKLAAEHHLILSLTDAAIRRLAELADSEHFGARELERVFRNEVLLPVTEKIQHAADVNGNSNITLLVDCGVNGKLSLTAVSPTL
jgi:ATP-dependent Clp protease ATP-binding subunit ClpC